MSDDESYTQEKLTPRILAEWWQESYNQIKLMHPHESQEFHEQLTERRVRIRIDEYHANERAISRPSEERIANWYAAELAKLRRFIRSIPLKERELLAAERVEARIRLWRKQRQLDEFFD
ncbi:MAG: hypothetical protein ACFFE8_10205 [Candidatus Heimdallarchaeota archaeon]